jgi:ribosome maturation factor RimP
VLRSFYFCFLLMNPAVRSATSVDIAAISAVIGPIAQAHGGEIAHIEMGRGPHGLTLRVDIEKRGAAEKKWSTEEAAVSLEICAEIAREASPALDVADVIPSKYNFEVGTPGVERELRHREDYERFVGKRARIKLYANAADPEKAIDGQLLSASESGVAVLVGAREKRIAFSDIRAGRLVFEFGPAAKPTKRPKRPGEAPGKTPKKEQLR